MNGPYSVPNPIQKEDLSMANKKLGALIKEARTNADLTQEKLAKAAGVTASDISKAERGEKNLTQEQLKKIAKATGVTQASLLNAAKGTTTKSATKTATKSSTKSTTKSTAKSATKSTAKSASSVSVKVTATEKKLLEAYREAEGDQKKVALYILQGESKNLWDDIIRNHSKDTSSNILGDLLGGLLGNK